METKLLVMMYVLLFTAIIYSFVAYPFTHMHPIGCLEESEDVDPNLCGYSDEHKAKQKESDRIENCRKSRSKCFIDTETHIEVVMPDGTHKVIENPFFCLG